MHLGGYRNHKTAIFSTIIGFDTEKRPPTQTTSDFLSKLAGGKKSFSSCSPVVFAMKQKRNFVPLVGIKGLINMIETNTPHINIFDAEGNLRYEGAMVT